MSATATIWQKSPGRTRWLVKGASNGKAYHVDTYPNSDLIYIQIAETGRAVPTHRAKNIAAEIRQAIKDAQP